MHGLQVSGRELRHRGWPDGDLSAGYIQRFLRLCVALLSVSWSCKGTKNAKNKNFVEDLDYCPEARPATKISAVLSS